MPSDAPTSAADRWDARYAHAAPPCPGPPDALAGLEVELPSSGTALDVACGTGAQTLWLAARGLHVVALDVSPRAIEILSAAARAHRLSALIDARRWSLDEGLPAGLTGLDVLVCQRFRDPLLYDPFVRALRRGGIGVVTVLSAVGRRTSRGRSTPHPGSWPGHSTAGTSSCCATGRATVSPRWSSGGGEGRCRCRAS